VDEENQIRCQKSLVFVKSACLLHPLSRVLSLIGFSVFISALPPQADCGLAVSQVSRPSRFLSRLQNLDFHTSRGRYRLRGIDLTPAAPILYRSVFEVQKLRQWEIESRMQAPVTILTPSGVFTLVREKRRLKLFRVGESESVLTFYPRLPRSRFRRIITGNFEGRVEVDLVDENEETLGRGVFLFREPDQIELRSIEWTKSARGLGITSDLLATLREVSTSQTQLKLMSQNEQTNPVVDTILAEIRKKNGDLQPAREGDLLTEAVLKTHAENPKKILWVRVLEKSGWKVTRVSPDPVVEGIYEIQAVPAL
jgi:hypothetical protein